MSTSLSLLFKDPYFLGYLVYVAGAAGLHWYMLRAGNKPAELDIFLFIHFIVSWLVLKNITPFASAAENTGFGLALFVLGGLAILGLDFFVFIYQLVRILMDVVYTAGYRLGRSLSSLF